MNLNELIRNEQELHGAIIGCLMGDMGIIRRTPTQNAYFTMTHSLEQKDYLEFKSKILEMNPCVLTRTSERNTYLKATDKTYLQFHCVSNQNEYATYFYNMIYPNKKKIVTSDILDKITDLGLFLWYLDDGYMNVRYYTGTNKIKEYRVFLYTMNFSLEEVQLIKEWFEKKYDISPNINKKQNGYILYFNSKKTRKLMEVFDKFYNLVPCLNRKFLKEYI